MAMENMLHLAPRHASVPDSFVLPPEQVPPATTGVVSLPVVDLSGGHEEVRGAILDAGREYGFFQVVNHGVPAQVMRDMESVCDEFYRLPAADKAHLYSEDRQKPNRLFSGTTYDTGGERYWMDCLRLSCPADGNPGDSDSDRDSGWPDKPPRLREVFEAFVAGTRGVGAELLRLLCDAVGLRRDYFDGDLSRGDAILGVNHYPPCPDPAVTLGLPPHCDRNLITLLVTGPVHGLEVLYGGEWVKVQHVPGAFVVNFGLQIEVVTNGMIKSAEHRVMTNADLPRTSAALFICPTEDCVVGPAEELLGDDGNPPCYRAVRFGDFRRIYGTVKLGSSLNLTTNLKNNQQHKDI